MKTIKTCIAALCIAASMSATDAPLRSKPSDSPKAEATISIDSVKLSVTVPDEVAPGHPVRLTVTLANQRTRKAGEILVWGWNPGVDIVVRSPDKQEHSLRLKFPARGFSPAETDRVSLNPGNSVEAEVNLADQVPMKLEGEYVIEAKTECHPDFTLAVRDLRIPQLSVFVGKRPGWDDNGGN